MSVGDKSAQSYGWTHKLDAAVPDGGEVVIPAPGYDHRYTDKRYFDVTTPGGAVFRSDKADAEGHGVMVSANATSHEEPVTLTVENHTGIEWAAGDTVYVFAPHLLAHAGNEWDLKEQIYDLQQRVLALEGTVVVEEEVYEEQEDDPHPKKSKKHK